ncbi:MAG: hypothetical protein KTR19_07850, partial [Hyphomicrobiales bacterium]|nr:hypothetical protein [Hyphomicrobiales bacterium]
TISDVPDGATLSAGTDNGDGTWTLTPDQLGGLTITPPQDFSGEIELTVAATSTDGTDTATTTETLTVDVTAVADAPRLTMHVSEPAISEVGGTEITTTIDCSNYSQTNSGFTMAARTIQADGTLSEASIDNVGFSGSSFGVAGVSSGPYNQIGYSQAHDVSEKLIIAFDNPVDQISFEFDELYRSEGSATGHEEGLYALYLDGVLVGEGSFLGTETNEGSVTATAENGGMFDQIIFKAASSYHGDATTPLGEGSDYYLTKIEFPQTVGGTTTATYDLEIETSLLDTDGSETLSLTLSDLPEGATLNQGTDNGDGTWSLEPEDLAGLQLTTPGDGSSEFSVTATATATENDGDTTSITITQQVDSQGSVGAPVFHTANSDVTYDAAATPVAIADGATVTDPNGSDITEAVVAITDGYQLGDILALDGVTLVENAFGQTMIEGTNIELVNGGFDTDTNTLMLKGEDTPENYQAVLNSVTFNNDSSEAASGDRVIDFQVVDETGLINAPATVDVHVDLAQSDLPPDPSPLT